LKSLGLALGGGGLKGFAHIGVLQALEDEKIPVAAISGTSAGSIIAALHVCGISAYMMEEIVLRTRTEEYIDYNYSGAFKWLLSLYIPFVKANFAGIIKGDKLEALIYKYTGGKRLVDAAKPIAIIACDIDTGKEIIFSNCNFEVDCNNVKLINEALLSEAVRCSTAIPATFVPYRLKGMQLVDGGIRSIVPVTVQKVLGADYILAVNLGQATYTQSVSGIPQIISRTLDILTYETSDTAEQITADMIIYPGVKDVSLFNMDAARKIIHAGKRTMQRQMDYLTRELNQ